MAPSVHYLSHGATTGYGEAGRRLVLALEAAGVDVRWTPITFDPSRPRYPDGVPVDPTLDHLRGERAPADVTVVHAVPEMAAPLRPLAGDGAYVGHTVWETDRLQPHWPALLDALDGVIVPTAWNAEVFAASGVHVPLEVVPHVAPMPAAAADRSWLPERALGDQPVLTTIAEWQHRKAPWLAIEAYARAFGRDEDVLLVLKTGERVWDYLVDPEDTSPRRAHVSWHLAKALGQIGPTPPLALVDRWLTHEQLAGLHDVTDVHVALSHGEGWDLGTFDAACGGKAVVATGWGAPAEYLDPEAAWLVPAELVPVPSLPGDLTPGEGPGHWVDPDLDAAAEQLREAVAPSPVRRQAIAAQAERLRREHAPEAIAARFLAALDRILQGAEGPGVES